MSKEGVVRQSRQCRRVGDTSTTVLPSFRGNGGRFHEFPRKQRLPGPQISCIYPYPTLSNCYKCYFLVFPLQMHNNPRES